MSDSLRSRIIAMDYGRRRIGLAVSDPLGITAQSLPALIVDSHKDALNKIEHVVSEYNPSLIVFGLPLNQFGKEGDMAVEVKEFGTLVKAKIEIEVDYFDERFTSKQAEKALHEMGKKTGHNKAKIDSLSALFLLQSYMSFCEAKKNRD